MLLHVSITKCCPIAHKYAPPQGGLGLVPLTKRLAAQGCGPLPTLFASLVWCECVELFPAVLRLGPWVLCGWTLMAGRPHASLLARALWGRVIDARTWVLQHTSACFEPARRALQGEPGPRDVSVARTRRAAGAARRALPRAPGRARATSDRTELRLLSADWFSGFQSRGERSEPGRAARVV
jgi:hypothetical protein